MGRTILIIVIITIAIAVYLIIRGVQKLKRSPQAHQVSPASVVAKRTVFVGSGYEWCITFELPDHEQLELVVSHRIYDLLLVGDYGSLARRDLTFVGFQRELLR
ncbi:MAG: DUF2500 domain-containing protein [Propionibacteriaceae bacterium]|nr:DUF2500 domain-containing protein [Propionibacteriaceae bacterium]